MGEDAKNSVFFLVNIKKILKKEKKKNKNITKKENKKINKCVLPFLFI